MKTYVVTVTPSLTLYAGAWQSSPYTFNVYAKDRAHALKQARAGYEDRKQNPARFTARLVKEAQAPEPFRNAGTCCAVCGTGFDFPCRCD